MPLLCSNVIDFAHIINFELEPQKQRAQQMRRKDDIYNFAVFCRYQPISAVRIEPLQQIIRVSQLLY